MLVHTVVFWLKEDLSKEQVAAFRGGLETLRSIVYAKAVYIGTPADTAADDAIVDRSYTYAATFLFNNVSDHDEYQVHPVHKRFLKNYGDFWSKILVYDFG